MTEAAQHSPMQPHAPSAEYLREAIRKPHTGDVPAIQGLIDPAAQAGAILPRSAAELYEKLRDFHIYEDEKGLGGCCALHIDLPGLAEVRTLLVREDLRGRGIGKALVHACIDEARELGIGRVYALTRSPQFFARFGFREIDKHELPNKVFRDCLQCPKYTHCDETALIADVGQS
jgi:amino-acid N-acetyltransferase